jgi:hypothetical protein
MKSKRYLMMRSDGKSYVVRWTPTRRLCVRASPKSKTKAKEGEGQSDSEERVEVHADLGAVVDGIRVTPSGEGKKRKKRRPL